MQITVKGKNVNVTDALRSYAEKRIDKIARFFDSIISIDVTLSTERNWHIVEVTVYGNGFVLRGEERTDDMYASIDKVLDKLEKQVKREKGKYKSRMSKARKHTEMEYFRVDLPRGEDTEIDDDTYVIMDDPMVVRAPMMLQKPMTLEEALKEIESLDFSFLVFNNADNNTLNVLYKRKTGYGLIDPTMDPVE